MHRSSLGANRVLESSAGLPPTVTEEKMSKVLITYKRRRVLKKTNPCADTNDDSSCKNEGEASASKHLAPTAEETAEKDKLNEEKVVPESGIDAVDKRAPTGFPQVNGKPSVFHVHVGEASSFDVEKLGSGCMGTQGSSQHPVNSSMQSQLNQVEPTQCDPSRECTFQVTKKKGKGEMKDPGVSTFEKELTEKASNASFHHVSPNSQFHESFVKDPQRREAVSDLGYENTNYIERKTQEHFGGESSESWHKPDHYGSKSSSSWCRPAYETMFKGSEVLKEKHNILFGNCARTTIQWSEDELDFLWLGVRRHGQNNWNTILTDTNLCFLKSRVAEDLAEQWAKERKKIVNEVFYEPRKFTRPVHPPSTFATKTAAKSQYYGSNILPTNSEFTQCNGETRRSIGDIFFQSMNNFNCTSPNPSRVTIAEPISFRPPPGPFLAGNLVRSGYPMSGIRQQLNRFTLPNQAYPFRSSNWCQNSVETPAWRNQCSPSVPDWFVNTFNKYQENSESPSASCFRQYMPKNEGQTPSFPKYGNPPVPPNNSHGHGLLKRKNLAYGELDGSTTIQYMPLKEQQTSSFLNHGDPPAPPNNSHGRGLLKRMSMASGDCSGNMKMHGNLVSLDEVQMRNGSSMFSSIGLTFKKPALSDSGRGMNDGLNLSLKCSATAEPSEASTEDTVSDSGNKTR